ncbi:LOW QUALITY PROTEIN: hypothetical protein Cgig2_025339 [Carnegiea gigantea]|uniref:Aminotransferase-like plant mobile domain-containing protein n=1 Tax=Carnegiea gigantea TaxID=171969 RepID=A0A9Q1JRY3_9CARY|nr:LOW QUALITY PROTEIN: hypothetical protein Cgig2_025339 [Carnegiea gigantea]
MWSPVLKCKPFVMDRHLVHALVKSWVSESKAFRIGRREVPFSVYDVALLTGLPATRKHVIFDEGSSIGVELPIGSNRGHKGEDPIEEKLVDAWVRNETSGMVWLYEHTKLYAHADEKCVPCIISCVNLCAASMMLHSSFRPSRTIRWGTGCAVHVRVSDSLRACGDGAMLMCRLLLSLRCGTWREGKMREERQTVTEALTLGRVAHAATKKELEHMRALLMGRDWGGDSLPGGTQNEGLQSTDGDGEGSAHASDRRVSTSQGDDRYSFHTNFHNADVGSAKDAQECEPFSDTMQPERKNEMVTPPM